MGSLLALTHASPLQVVLADTGAPLTPQEEAAFFSRHPEAASYRVLRWEAGAVKAGRDKREVNTDSSLRLHLPLPPGHLELVLEKNSIVAPDLESWSHNSSAAGNEAQVLADCFYSGGFSVSWAVISTCDGLVSVKCRLLGC
ncbi:hypothetical protein E2C01_026914 [Portunus trituberculatus]|uniref:Uncharacterized protein n=1 Tax=Portunus trituberculatus TaxID=210409 RepID=A0A5B7EK98_PORTR|nr:hypothetical protein [Portunus trituberculatus]